MKYDSEKLKNWERTIEYALPSMFSIVSAAQGRGLIFGAAVLQIYYDLGWINRARSTGDLDLSIGLMSSADEYNKIRKNFLDAGYLSLDPDRYFRLVSPNHNKLTPSFIDFVAHPQGQVDAKSIRGAMGVGNNWSFDEFIFACESSYEVSKNVFFPNPLGFLALKRASFEDDPRRVRDLVDIVDVVFDLVEKGFHYDLVATWKIMKSKYPQSAISLIKMISGIATEAVAWDFQIAKQEFLTRNYDLNKLEEETPKVFQEFLENFG
jgi:hypothetical protein